MARTKSFSSVRKIVRNSNLGFDLIVHNKKYEIIDSDTWGVMHYCDTLEDVIKCIEEYDTEELEMGIDDYSYGCN